MPDVSLIVADPGHFHAALVQKEMYPNLSPDVHVYAPLGPDLADYLTRNTRKEQPTHWKLEVHAGPDFLERMCRERLGTIAISSGRNRDKVRQIQAAIDAGINVLADKPVIIRRDELPVLEAALDAAEERGLILYDMSSGGRQQIIPCLTRLLCNDPDVFGDPVPGTRSEPGVKMESVHHIMKRVAGVPNLRPAWFFDVTQQGESLADVGTHLVDRAHSTLFPEQAIDYRTDIRVHEASRWPTVLRTQFRQVTGEADWPDYLEPWIKTDALQYFCNTPSNTRFAACRWPWRRGGTGKPRRATTDARLLLRQPRATGIAAGR
jgi:Putative oxidoreductase C terminal domain